MLSSIEDSWHLGIFEEVFCYTLLSFHLRFSFRFVLFCFPGFYSCQSPLPLECAVQGRNLGMLGKDQVSEWSRQQSACLKWTFLNQLSERIKYSQIQTTEHAL